MKKALTLLCALLLALGATSCAGTSNQTYYERAQLYLGNGDFEAAAHLFSQLGEYADAADYALYSAALQAIREENFALARVNLEEISPFKSTDRYLRYIEAKELEAADDFEAALNIYTSLGSFEDAYKQAERLRTIIPEQSIQQGRRLMAQGKYEEARALFETLDGYGESGALINSCNIALTKIAYSEATAMYNAGDYVAALAAFESLGGALDASDRAAQCRAMLKKELDDAYAKVTLKTAAEVIAAHEAYAALTDDAECAQRLEELKARYGVNLSLLSAAKTGQPYVLLGAYPMGESGMESALLWQVIDMEGMEVTLLCQSVIDAAPVATLTDLTLTEEEQDAVVSTVLPSVSDLASLTDLACAATPYAVAQGVAQEGGQALYWLRDSLESGVHPVVSGNGTLMLPGTEVTPGVRPMLVLSLEDYVFTSGDGTAENPYR